MERAGVRYSLETILKRVEGWTRGDVPQSQTRLHDKASSLTQS